MCSTFVSRAAFDAVTPAWVGSAASDPSVVRNALTGARLAGIATPASRVVSRASAVCVRTRFAWRAARARSRSMVTRQARPTRGSTEALNSVTRRVARSSFDCVSSSALTIPAAFGLANPGAPPTAASNASTSARTLATVSIRSPMSMRLRRAAGSAATAVESAAPRDASRPRSHVCSAGITRRCTTVPREVVRRARERTSCVARLPARACSDSIRRMSSGAVPATPGRATS